jgi:hypothetical protein
MKKPVLVAILIGAAILGIIIYSSLGLSANRVEVCLEFKGKNTCKIARAETQEEAIRRAVDNICGELASGVTEVMACGRTQPSKINVLK